MRIEQLKDFRAIVEKLNDREFLRGLSPDQLNQVLAWGEALAEAVAGLRVEASAVLGAEDPEPVFTRDEPDDDCPLDGDHETGLASAGWGTDEDYGYFGDDCDDS